MKKTVLNNPLELLVPASCVQEARDILTRLQESYVLKWEEDFFEDHSAKMTIVCKTTNFAMLYYMVGNKFQHFYK